MRSQASATFAIASRRAELTTARTHGRIQAVLPDAEPHPGRRANAVPRASRCLVDVDQSRHRRAHRSGGTGVRTAASFGVTTMAGRLGAELGILRSAKRSLWPTRISLSKHQRTRTQCPRPRLSPRRACGLGRVASSSKCRLRQGRAASCAELSQCRRKAPPTHPRALSLAAPRLPQPGPARRHLRPPPGVRPRQTAPEGKDAGIGFANLSGK